MKKIILLSITSLSLLSACASSVTTPNKAYGKVPPQLVIQMTKSKNGKVTKRLAWDHPDYFGSVPRNKRKIGNNICKSAGYRKAIGYHPKAKNVNGKILPKGGYYCSK